MTTIKVEKLATRSIATRAKILATAERLFARRGVDGVSLNEINKAAGQRNRNALQYHFGTKYDLLQAILDKHTPGITQRRHELLDAMENSDEFGLIELVRALVVPIAEKLGDPDGGVEYLLINAQLTASHVMGFYNIKYVPLRTARNDRWGRLTAQKLTHLPDQLIEQRMMLVVGLIFHGLADHARMREESERPSALVSTPLLISNLVDSATAVLADEPSAETRSLLETPRDRS